jgi:transposase
MKQTKLRTDEVVANNNISFPIGTILTVRRYYEKLALSSVFGKYKRKGRDINRLIEGLVSYKLTENLSISKASEWLNRPVVLEEFNLRPFEERTLFRALEIIGANKEEAIYDIQTILFDLYDFEHTDANMDWTSLVLYGDKSNLGKYGYSRDHRPDKKQITLGITELRHPINIPIGITINKGNVNDQTHFKDSYEQIKTFLQEGSLIVFDKGANSKDNLDLIQADKMKYLTAKKLNTSDDKRIKNFKTKNAILLDPDAKVHGQKFSFPSRFDYFFFSERLKAEQIEAKMRKAERKLKEAKEIQASIDKNKQLPKRFRINNELVDITYTYQTKLSKLSEQDALKLVKKACITGREGFFCLTSSEDLTLEQALQTYRQKDSIEKIMNSLKNEIEIKPLRVWTDNSIYGAILIGFLAQLFMSLIRYDHKEVQQKSTKFIKISLMNLTVTIEKTKNRRKRRIFSNFDPINCVILGQKQAVT